MAPEPPRCPLTFRTWLLFVFVAGAIGGILAFIAGLLLPW